MSVSHDGSTWLEDNLLVPRAGRIWPWVLTAMVLFFAGLYLLIPIGKESPVTGTWRTVRVTPAVDDLPAPAKDHWTLGCVDSSSSSFAKMGALFAADVAKRSEGRVKIQVAPQGMLGDKKLDELGIIKAVQKGELDMAIVTSSPLTNVSSDFEVLDLPYLFRNSAHADKVMLGPTGKKIMDSLQPTGIKALASMEIGFRILTTAEPLPKLADFQKKRMRVMQSSTAISMARLLGCEPVPSPVDKIHEMGEKHLIDAADRTYPTYWDFKLYEVFPYITESGHSYSVKIMIVNAAVLKKLSVADQEAIQAAALAVEMPQREMQRQEDARVKRDCIAAGIHVYVLDAQERKRFEAACEPLFEEYSKLRGPALLEAIRSVPNSATPSQP